MSLSYRKYLLPLVHGVVWLCLFSYPFLFHYLSFSDERAVLRMALFILLLMSLFYFNTWLLIPKLLGRKKIILYLLSIGTLITAISLCSGYLQIVLNPDYEKKPELFRISVNTGIITSILTWFISSGIKVTSEWFKNQRMMQEIKSEKLFAELNFLKSQVNPHFLFNALNNIYSLQNKNSPETGTAILKLSELIRYVLYETSTEFVPLEKEINYLKNYIELQKLGLTDSVSINFSLTGDLSNKFIQPLLLIPLVENMFKHGISYKGNTQLTVQLKVDGDLFELLTQNPIVPKSIEKSTGIGLLNLRKRLDLLYPGKNQFETKSENGSFISKLKIELK